MAVPIEVTVKETEPAVVAYLKVKGSFKLIPESFGKLYSLIAQHGLVPSGPPSGVYYNSPRMVPESELLWELRSPIAGNVPASGPDESGFGVTRIEPALVAATMHKGPFERIGETYDAMMTWMAESQYDYAGPSEEVYLTDASRTPSEELLTEVRFPLCKK